MSFLLNCPNCGLRDVSEFRYGGQIVQPSPPPARLAEGGEKELAAATNLPGPQRERWYHRFGCRHWFMAERDVTKNQVLHTGWLDESAS